MAPLSKALDSGTLVESWALLFKCGVHPRGPSLLYYNKVRRSASKGSSPQLFPLQKVSIIQTASMFGIINFAGNFLCICASGQARQDISSTLQASAPSHVLHSHSRTGTVQSTWVAKKHSANKPTTQPGPGVKALRFKLVFFLTQPLFCFSLITQLRLK